MKKVKVKYGGFETEQEVEDTLYNAIYIKAIDEFISKLGSNVGMGSLTKKDLIIARNQLEKELI